MMEQSRLDLRILASLLSQLAQYLLTTTLSIGLIAIELIENLYRVFYNIGTLTIDRLNYQ
jgi:hypothetical protein